MWESLWTLEKDKNTIPLKSPYLAQLWFSDLELSWLCSWYHIFGETLSLSRGIKEFVLVINSANHMEFLKEKD